MSRAIRFASLAAAALVAVATTACSDGPTVPAAPAAPASVAAEQPLGARSVGPTILNNYANISLVNGQGVLQSGRVTISNLQNNNATSVIDNGAWDLNPEKGRLRVKLSWPSGAVLRATAYMDAPYSDRSSVERTMVVGTTDFGALTVQYMPVLHATLTRTDASGLVAGGGIQVITADKGQLIADVRDNMAGDFDPAIGRIQAYYDTDAKVHVVEDPIPTGFQAPSNWHLTVQLPYSLVTSQAHTWTWVHTPFTQPK